MIKPFKFKLLFSFFIAVLLLSAGCSVNPVTGEQEVSWIDEEWERKTGQQYYGLQQQAGGGRYLIDPDLTLYVKSVGQRITPHSRRSSLPYEFVVLNDSSPNAWALPGGKIAINRGLLLALNNEAELAAVLAHEIVHADARHSAQSQELGSIISIGQVLASELLSNAGYNHQAIQQGIAYSGLYGQTRYSRSRELEADLYGMKYMSAAGYDSRAAISLQKTFVELSKDAKSDSFSQLFASHPPSQERVNANQQTSLLLPLNGERGEDRYRQELRLLRKRQPAYALSDQAKTAIADKKYRQAINLADQAIAIEPMESEFYEVKGAAQTKIDQASAALISLNKAVALNKHYYSPVLRRGILQVNLKAYDLAEQDLLASVKLAPSQIAFLTLAEIAQQKQNCPAEKRYLRQALSASNKNRAAINQQLTALNGRC
ncbi:MAG: M48 family metalloprotease [Pseudomonadales bacterium]|nr:M48 family metalloprotease [Pseudomonadales bacterium]